MKTMEADDPRLYAHIATEGINDGNTDSPYSDFVKLLAVAFWNHAKGVEEDDIELSREEAIDVLEGIDVGWEGDFTSP